MSRVGGTLYLTDDELIVKPLSGFGRRKVIPLREIECVRPFATRPPRLQIEASGGKPITLAVITRRMTTMNSTDTTARDDALERIRQAMSS